MAPTKVQFCGLHKIGYNTDYDPICPQCGLAKHLPAKHYDYDVVAQTPLDATGKPQTPAASVP
jgi:hypothetical protein